MLLNYLESKTSQAIPGFSGNFVTKYTAPEMDQILVEMLDYIRSQNLADVSATNVSAPRGHRSIRQFV